MPRRVVITGVGPVSSIGIGKDSFWNSAKEGKGYFRNVDFDDVELEQYRSRICSPIDNFDPSAFIENPKDLKRSGKATKYAVVGSYLALSDAGYKINYIGKDQKPGGPKYYQVEGLKSERVGVVIGQSTPNIDIEYPEHVKFIRDHGPKKVNPFTLPQTNINAGASAIAEWFFLKGTGFSIATACASATHAIGIATFMIQNGMEDVVITGGADAPIDSYVFSGFDIIRALSRRNDDPMRASRPFDRDRDGFVLGEGAGILVIESLEHAARRGAPIYAEIVGYAFSQDAYHLVAPDPYGISAINALKKSLEVAGIVPEEVEYINAHGTSTILNDPNESYIIKQVFGDYAYKIPISSSKSYFGHPLGAAGGLEAIVTVLAMTHSIIPPTANLENPDVDYVDKSTPELDKRCDLDYVPIVSRKKAVSVALSESFGFGGQNAVIVFKRYTG